MASRLPTRGASPDRSHRSGASSWGLLDKTRALAALSLEKAMITSLEGTLQHVRQKGDKLHPATLNTLAWLHSIHVN